MGSSVSEASSNGHKNNVIRVKSSLGLPCTFQCKWLFCSRKSAHFASIRKAQFTSLVISEGTVIRTWFLALAETCFLTFNGRDLPLVGLKMQHNREPIPMVMVTNSFIFAFLDELKVVCFSFDFWHKHFLKVDT